MLARAHALVVPLLVAFGTIAFLVQVSGARRSVVVVPHGVAVFIGLLFVVVLVKDLRSPPEEPAGGLREAAEPIGLLALSIGYYFFFQYVSFDVANFLFVLSAGLLMRLDLARAGAAALASALVLAGLAWAMNFNVPDPFWAG